MPKIQYIGRTNDFSGKPLWEILGNLKNMGVGRLVMRNMHRRYPEPCFYRILQAEPLLPTKGEDRRVRAVVEKVFRGRRYPNVIEMEGQTYKADFRLVPKHEEAALWKAVEATQIPERILPPTTEFPPLLKVSGSGQDTDNPAQGFSSPRTVLNVIALFCIFVCGCMFVPV